MHAYGITRLNENTVDLGIPLNGMFELTEDCNLHCKFCYVSNRGQKKACRPGKSTAEWVDMIRQATDAGMLVCTFTGGEPFIREDFEEIYCKAYDMGLRIAIFTNATLVGEKERLFLRKRPPGLISISLYGSSEKSYESLCGNARDFHLAIESINALYAEGFHIEIKTLPLKPLIHELRSIGQLATAYHCPAKLDIYIGPCRDSHNVDIWQMRIPSRQIREALAAFYEGAQISNPPDLNLEAADADLYDHMSAIPCQAGKNTFCILPDGRMLGCPTLTCFESSPFITGFAKAWNQLREKMEEATVCDECRHCLYSLSCPSCPSIRAGETGSVSKCNQYLRSLASCLSEIT